MEPLKGYSFLLWVDIITYSPYGPPCRKCVLHPWFPSHMTHGLALWCASYRSHFCKLKKKCCSKTRSMIILMACPWISLSYSVELTCTCTSYPCMSASVSWARRKCPERLNAVSGFRTAPCQIACNHVNSCKEDKFKCFYHILQNQLL